MNGAHISGSPFDVEVVKSKKAISKKRKAASDEDEPRPSAQASPAKRSKPNEESLSRKPTILQYEESDEDATGDKMFVISPPSKPKPSASSKQYKVQSDLDAPTLIIDEAPKSKVSSSAAAPAPTKAASKPKMVFEDEDDGSTMPMDFVPPPKKASAATAAPPAERKKAPAILHNDEDEDSQEGKRQNLDDSTGLLRLDSAEEDEDGYNTGDSEIERSGSRKRSAPSAVPEKSQPPPPKKRSLIVDSDDDDDEPMVRHVPKAAPKKQAAPPPKPKIVSDEEDEIEPTLLI